ncbi:hypothetical protein M426DRAFT_317821 [Hypoxylon sp. CI-4A]|nr:hypothetical protein M426DRAFT_317821 [Hypoxylon sp. CI-4A]
MRFPKTYGNKRPRNRYELKIKQELSEEDLGFLLAEPLYEGDNFWNDVIHSHKSTSTASKWAVRTSVTGFFPLMNHVRFEVWRETSDADKANFAAHPENFGQHTTEESLLRHNSVRTSWAGNMTGYTVTLEKRDAHPDQDRPYLDALEDFPYQSIGDMYLRDDTTIFGTLHIGLRPVKGEDFQKTNDGIEMATV